jgi:amino acid transporter
MILATSSNSLMQLLYIICLLFTLGDISQVTNTPTGVPLIEVYYQATNSKPATNFLVLMPMLLVFSGLFNLLASASRLTWAFARDNGLPFSKVFVYVRKHCLGIPYHTTRERSNITKTHRSTPNTNSP